MSGSSPNPAAPRRFIVGTAGHVDHGKTELVGALTGHDTDRLREEKERGISILLGFAPLSLGDVFLGIVDVPGHERFVKQMVAGAGGLDMAILLVAADEGVMPQTKEHMEVLNSLNIGAGVVVISKRDLSADDMMELLREDIAELTRGTFLQDAPIVETSARTGEGLDHLRSTLHEIAGSIQPRDASGPFRLAVDRVFHQKGIGVVLTGSCYSGTVSVGDALELLPSGKSGRIRELQSFGEKRESGHAGERLAIALQGVKLEEVHRGDMLCTPGHFTATEAVDVRIRLADYDSFQLKNRERVRVHHGAREALGRVILLDADTVDGGHEALAQIKMETPVVAAKGDYVVLRKYSPARVVGGGVVIDPVPVRHKRFDDDALDRIRLREKGDPGTILLKTVESAGDQGLSEREVDAAVMGTLIESGQLMSLGGVLFHPAALAQLAERAEDIVSSHLARDPMQWGMDKEELRQRLAASHNPQRFNRILDALTAHRPLFVRENRVRAGTETLALPDTTQDALRALEDFVATCGLAFPTREQAAESWSGTDKFLDALQYLKDNGTVIDLGDGLIHRDALDRCLMELDRLFATQDEVSVPEVKSALGITRKHTIPLLEHLDSRRITVRRANGRSRGPKFPAEA